MEFEVFKEPRMILLVIINAPIYYLYFKIIFGNIWHLRDSIQLSSQNDIKAYAEGTLLDEWWHTFKILFWLFICYKTVLWEYGKLFE